MERVPLRIWRLRRGYSQRELARLANVSYLTLLRTEHGIRNPSFATWRKLAKALDVPLEAIAEYVQQRAPDIVLFERAKD